MNWIRITSVALFIVALSMLGYFVYRIKYRLDEEKRIKRIERTVIDKLMLIRDAEVAYRTVNGQYTSDWDKLIEFVRNGEFYITERKETIITLDYGADSLVVGIDTLGTTPVYDSLFNESVRFQLENLPYLPHNREMKFEIFADKITKGGVTVDVFEVKDSDPVDPRRIKNENPLRVGSRTDVTTAGNWE